MSNQWFLLNELKIPPIKFPDTIAVGEDENYVYLVPRGKCEMQPTLTGFKVVFNHADMIVKKKTPIGLVTIQDVVLVKAEPPENIIIFGSIKDDEGGQ